MVKSLEPKFYDKDYTPENDEEYKRVNEIKKNDTIQQYNRKKEIRSDLINKINNYVNVYGQNKYQNVKAQIKATFVKSKNLKGLDEIEKEKIKEQERYNANLKPIYDEKGEKIQIVDEEGVIVWDKTWEMTDWKKLEQQMGFTKVYDNMDELIEDLESMDDEYVAENEMVDQTVITTVAKTNLTRNRHGKKQSIFTSLNEGFCEYFKDISIFNPNTFKLCFSHCLAMFNFVRSDALTINYQDIRNEATKISKEENIEDGLEKSRLQEMAIKYQINIFIDNDTDNLFTIEENPDGAIFIDADYSHALFILPKSNKKHDILLNSYKRFSESSQRIFDKTEKDPHLYLKNQCYVSYDFEFFTYEDKKTGLLDKFPYMFSIA